MVQQVFQGYESIIAYSSHPSKVAQSILNVINSPNPEIRNPVGKDAVSMENKNPDQFNTGDTEESRRAFS